MGIVVNCFLSCCSNNIEGYCQLDEITIGDMSCCMDYEEKKIDMGNYVFYARCSDEKGYYWEERLGTKEVIEGIDFFWRYGFLTHGRTGLAALRSADDTMKDTVLKKLEIAESEMEISPLYNDNCKLKIYKEGERR